MWLMSVKIQWKSISPKLYYGFNKLLKGQMDNNNIWAFPKQYIHLVNYDYIQSYYMLVRTDFLT